jgi:hypothetical protein
MELKGTIPYAQIQKAITADGEDAHYHFQLSDFADVMLGGANALGWDHAQFQRVRQQWDSEELALRALGLDQVPPTAQQRFAALRTDWEQRGLTTALKVVEAYQVTSLFIAEQRGDLLLG